MKTHGIRAAPPPGRDPRVRLRWGPVGLTATFGVFSTLPPDRRASLAEAAIREPYAEIQAPALAALAALGRHDVAIRHFASLAPAVRDRMLARAGPFTEAARREAKSPREGDRRVALETLAHLGGPGALPDLDAALRDPAPAVVAAAAGLLEAVGAKYLFHAVSFRMYADAESRLFLERHGAAMEGALGPLLRDYAAHGKRAFLEIALETVPIPEALLAETALSRRDQPAWKALVQALSESASERALRYVLALAFDSVPRHRAAAEEALARRRDPGFPRLLATTLSRMDREEREVLAAKFRELPFWPALEAAPDLETDAARCILDFLAASGLPAEARDERLAFYGRSPYPEVRLRALALLQNLGSPRAPSHAVRCLGDPSDEVKLAAARAVIAQDPPDKARLLLPLLSAESEDLRRLVQREIAGSSFDRFLRGFDRMEPGTRETAARALAKIDARILDRLADQVASLDPDRRLKALRIVDVLDAEKELRETLLALLEDPDRRVRATALRIVRLTESEAGIRLLTAALSDPDRRVRANAIEAFEDARDPSCIPVILPYVSDPDNRVRANAAKALAAFGRPEGRATLEAMLRDPEEAMRLSAAWALGQAALEGARELLQARAREERSTAVRRRIAEALALPAPASEEPA